MHKITIDPEVTGVSRHEIIERLEAENIEARSVWEPMHLQPLFAGMAYYLHDEGNTDYYLSSMTMEEQERVIGLIEGCWGSNIMIILECDAYCCNDYSCVTGTVSF